MYVLQTLEFSLSGIVQRPVAFSDFLNVNLTGDGWIQYDSQKPL